MNLLDTNPASAPSRRCVGQLLIVASLVAVIGCPGAQRRTSRFGPRPDRVTASDGNPAAAEIPDPPPLLIRSESRVVEFDVGGQAVRLNATATFPTLNGDVMSGPVVVFVPGASDVSRRGLRRGDGVTTYATPTAVTVAWQEAFGASGALSLAYDKRTCGPNDDPECNKNPQSDLDDKGPVALAADVDAACELARTLPGFDGRLVLVAHGQSTQIALASTCATSAAAVVLLSPIPREIDAVLVDALLTRHASKVAEAKAAPADQRSRLQDEAVALRNLAATRQAGFASMRSGKFSKEARVDGATIAFWLGWMELTGRTRALLGPVKGKTLVVLGTGDLQLGDGDKTLVRGLPVKRILEVDADHHLLTDGVLSPGISLPVVDAVVGVLQPPAS